MPLSRKPPAGMTRMAVTPKEKQVIMKMRYDDEKMLEGWNHAIDACISIVDHEYPADGAGQRTLYEVLDHLKSQMAEAKK